jgi:hypothetical protein
MIGLPRKRDSNGILPSDDVERSDSQQFILLKIRNDNIAETK